MSTITRPRGPLPARVYWVRRLLVLGLVVALVVVLARVLGGDGDQASGRADGVARQTAGDVTDEDGPSGQESPAGDEEDPDATPEEDAREDGADDGAEAGADGGKDEKEPKPARPEGRCEPEDLVVEPVVKDPVAGSPVRIVLAISSRESEACNWTASPETLVVDITSGDDDIWTSRHCAGRLEEEEVVPRREKPARVAMVWSGKRSDEECSSMTRWALPGWYHVRAAAYSGEPTEEQFELAKPERPVVKRTVPPKEKKKQKRRDREQRPTEEPLRDGQGGAREPNG